MRMVKDTALGEKFVSHIWDGGHFARNNLRAKDGRKLAIVRQGQLNHEEGADFHNAEIEIGGEVYKGDVEIHVRCSHWRVHHHDVNSKYNNTILHVVMWDDTIKLLTRKQNGEFIPTLVLYDHLDASIGKLWKQIELGGNKTSSCPANIKKMPPESITKILDKAGMERFLSRAGMFRAGSHQVIYERIMEALGYSKNKEQFRELAVRVPLKTLAGKNVEEIQAILFGVAGLLPSQNRQANKFDEETDDQLNKLYKIWERFAPHYENNRMYREQWNFFRIRPENHPVKRIAGISYILSKCDFVNPSKPLLPVFLSAFHELSQTPQKLSDILIAKASGYWTRHNDFGIRQHRENQYLIGENRADDIIVNVILPSVFACASGKDVNLQNSVTTLYSNYRKLQDNKITRYMESVIFHNKDKYISIIKSAMQQQGLIHLYKSYCDAKDCQNCPLSAP